MRILYFFLFTVFSTLKIVGQSSMVLIQNPLPRIGDEIEIEFAISSDSVKDLKAKGGSIKFKKVLSDTGKIVIGPFIFREGKQLYHTDSAVLHVDKALPLEAEGIWLHSGFYAGQQYLVVEQRIPGEWKVKRGENWSSSFVPAYEEFAELDLTTLKGVNLQFMSSWSGSKSMYLGEFSGKIDVMYKCYVYRIRNFSSDSSKIEKGNFINFPKKVKMEEFILK